MPAFHTLDYHYAPKNLRDRIAYGLIRLLRIGADIIFSKRYGHRAVVLETVAAVPGMVGGALQHFRALRRMKSDHGWIHTLLDEAENERQHLMTFILIAKPSRFERLLVLIIQIVFYNAYFLLYLISSRTAHRVVGYLEEEAVHSYSEYLAGVENGTYLSPQSIYSDMLTIFPNAAPQKTGNCQPSCRLNTCDYAAIPGRNGTRNCVKPHQHRQGSYGIHAGKS